jgi:hypothetical protein
MKNHNKQFNMKTLKILLSSIIALFFIGCSEDKMDEINAELNEALEMSAQSLLPDAELKTAFEATGTDLAWYATVYIEHSTGTWGQSVNADKRIGQTDATLMDNLWNSIYFTLTITKDMIAKTDPVTGTEDNLFARGIAQILTAYNLALLTDSWGEIPWTEALLGPENLQPKYDAQSSIYPKIQQFLDEGIATLNSVTAFSASGDYIYGGDIALWIQAAYSLKARYHLRLTNVDANAAANALADIGNGFQSNADNFLFDAYEATASGENPWYQFMFDRSHLSVGQTLYDLMVARNDPRIEAYFTQIDTSADQSGKFAYIPAPNGTAVQTQGGIYSVSLITEGGQTTATPMMTYHELKFIEAEAKFRTGDATWTDALQAAIAANFEFHGLDPAGAADYYTANVAPLLTSGNELNEILMQKYIAFYEHEAIEAYNDYRRVPAFLTLNNPANATAGFVWRYPYPTSEESSNSANIPSVNNLSDKVWWSGGAEKVK